MDSAFAGRPRRRRKPRSVLHNPSKPAIGLGEISVSGTFSWSWPLVVGFGPELFSLQHLGVFCRPDQGSVTLDTFCSSPLPSCCGSSTLGSQIKSHHSCSESCIQLAPAKNDIQPSNLPGDTEKFGLESLTSVVKNSIQCCSTGVSFPGGLWNHPPSLCFCRFNLPL